MSMNVEPKFSSIEQIAGQYLKHIPANDQNVLSAETKSFEEVLRQKQENAQKTGLKFSKHADSRLAERNINLTESQKKRLEDGAEKARMKGIKESLVVVDGMSFIVNVKNNTVVTVMSQEDSKEAVFTNIDGAVII